MTLLFNYKLLLIDFAKLGLGSKKKYKKLGEFCELRTNINIKRLVNQRVVLDLRKLFFVGQPVFLVD